jgi:integrase
LEGLYPHHRGAVSIGTVFHDHGLLHSLYARFRAWKRDRQRPCGLDLSGLVLPDYFPTDGVKKLKPPKSLIEWTPEEFRAVYRHSTKRLRRVMVGMIDLDIRQGDLEALRPENYNAYDDHLHWNQRKTGKAHSLPVTKRVRRLIIEARRNGWDFIFDTTNIVKEFREARHEAGVRKVLTLRALRKTAWNAVKRKTGDASTASQLAGHASTRTGIDHYEIPTNEGLRRAVNFVEKRFSTVMRRSTVGKRGS